MTPNLPGRYEHSIAKGEEQQPTAIAAFEVDEHVPCLGGCGAMVGPGQKCVACATAATVAWWENRRETDSAGADSTDPVRHRRRARRH